VAVVTESNCGNRQLVAAQDLQLFTSLNAPDPYGIVLRPANNAALSEGP
jgi:hypothetical protein